MKIVDKIKQDWQRGNKLLVISGLSGIAIIFAFLVWLSISLTFVFLFLTGILLTFMGVVYTLHLLSQRD